MNNHDYLLDFSLNNQQLEQLDKYMLLLQEWSKKINLTTITEDQDIYIKHYYDSLMLSKFLKDDICIADVGTGAGFPGIPLKIHNPRILMELIEPTQKRCLFLETIIKELQMDKIVVINERCENLSASQHKYDVVCSRAVASLNILIELMIPLLKKNGKMYTLKGSSFQEEIDQSQKALHELKATITNIYEYELPSEMGHRAIIEIEKLQDTPSKYPRVYAKIKKQPL